MKHAVSMPLQLLIKRAEVRTSIAMLSGLARKRQTISVAVRICKEFEDLLGGIGELLQMSINFSGMMFREFWGKGVADHLRYGISSFA